MVLLLGLDLQFSSGSVERRPTMIERWTLTDTCHTLARVRSALIWDCREQVTATQHAAIFYRVRQRVPVQSRIGGAAASQHHQAELAVGVLGGQR